MTNYDNNTISVIDNNDTNVITNCTENPQSEEALSIDGRIGVGALCIVLSVTFSIFYIYILYAIIKHKLWKIHSFYLWFVSIGFSDITNLFIYFYASILIVIDEPVLPLHINIWVGHVYNYAYTVCIVQYPVMALIRTMNVWAPMRSRQWHTTKNTVWQIAILWTSILSEVCILQTHRADWIYLNPSRMTWDNLDWDLYNREGFGVYWFLLPLVCVVSSLLLYALCYWKLRKISNKVHIRVNTETANQLSSTQKAERGLLKIGLVLSCILTVDSIFFLINGSIMQQSGLWALTLIEILTYGMNSIMFATLSSDIKRHTFIKRWSKQKSTTNGVFVEVKMEAIP